MIPYYFGKASNGNETGRPHWNQQQQKNSEKREPTVLIVEDELLVAENLKEVLQSGGYGVVDVVSSAKKAVERFPSLDPDLVIMDIRLEGTLDGVEAAVLIHQTLKRVPIIFLTAYPREDFPMLLSLDPDLYSFLSKPYEPSEFAATLKRLLPNR